VALRVISGVFKRPENAMLSILLQFAALEACTPSPQETAMHSATPDPGTTSPVSSETGAAGSGSVAPGTTGQDAGQAAQGPMLQAVSAAENPAPAPTPVSRVDSAEEAKGRKILSTAFVRVGPDGHLTVELQNGEALVLRDVVMRPKDYCGMAVRGGSPANKFCGRYADVAAARPGGVAADRAASAASNLVGPGRVD
jgi:hypothetical protein